MRKHFIPQPEVTSRETVLGVQETGDLGEAGKLPYTHTGRLRVRLESLVESRLEPLVRHPNVTGRDLRSTLVTPVATAARAGSVHVVKKAN